MNKRPPMIREAIADAVQRKVLAEGYTHAELARKADIQPRHLSDYLHNRRGLRPEKIERLLTALNLEIKPADEPGK